MSVLPSFILDAFKAIENGSIGDSEESQLLDFKEDPAVHQRERNPDAKLIDTLLDTAVCLVNGAEEDTHLVLGVADKVPGKEAFTGTQRKVDWIESKLSNNTNPPLRVEVTEIDYLGHRLLWIRIPRGLRFYERTKGQATYRVGKSCRPATSEVRQAIESRRRNPDFTAQQSTFGVDDLDGIALTHARNLWLKQHEVRGEQVERPTTTRAFLRELGLLDSQDQLTIAAELLFKPMGQGRVSARWLRRALPGAEPKAKEFTAPLVMLVSKLTDAIRDGASSEISRIDLGNGQETSIPAFPAQAVDEVVVNALVHRDWALLSPIVIDQTPRTLRVTSPGPLPFGVSADKLLTTHSVPRNSTLMTAFRRLGLAEESSRGFDRMWAAMLRSGREIPEVIADDNFVSVTISAGRPDANFINGVNLLATKIPMDIANSVFTLIILKHLYRNPIITWADVLALTEVSEMEAHELIDLLEEYEVLTALGDRFPQWSLTSKVATMFSKETVIHKPIEVWIREQLTAGISLAAREVAEIMGVGRSEVTAILSHLREQEEAQIDPHGPQRGPTTRWVAGPKLKQL